MPSLTSSWLRALIAVAIVAADVACAYFVFDLDSRPPWPFVALCALLVVFIVAAVKGRFVVAAIQLALLAVLMLSATTTIEDGSADVKMRLTVTGVPKGKTLRVVWSHQDGDWHHRVWINETWECVNAEGAGNAFRSMGLAQVSIHSSAITSNGGWYFGAFEDRLIVIVVDGKRYRFEARSIFGRYPTPKPEEFAATFDIGDYLSGKKEPPPVDWPPEETSASQIAPSESVEPN